MTESDQTKTSPSEQPTSTPSASGTASDLQKTFAVMQADALKMVATEKAETEKYRLDLANQLAGLEASVNKVEAILRALIKLKHKDLSGVTVKYNGLGGKEEKLKL